MQELVVPDIWDIPFGPMDAIGITTNGMWKSNGHAVMGAGIAKQADERIYSLGKLLGSQLISFGNHCYYFRGRPDIKTGRALNVLTFPTKHDWREKSDIGLIRQSCTEAKVICDRFRVQKVYLTRPGCGLGGLDWETQVKPVISQILDDRFIIVSQV